MRAKYSMTIVGREQKFMDFGLTDRLGRSIGLMVVTDLRTYEDRPAGDGNAYSLPKEGLGTWFTLYVQSARNGKGYGAAQDTKHFASAEERDAELERRITQYRKTAQKAAVR